MDEYGLTDFEGGLVLSIASLGILLASLPASALTQRISPRTLTLTSMMVIAIAGLAMAVAPTYAAIILARFIFGLGFGILWVAPAHAGRHGRMVGRRRGQRRRARAGPDHGHRGLRSYACPAYAGWVAEHFGLSALVRGFCPS